LNYPDNVAGAAREPYYDTSVGGRRPEPSSWQVIRVTIDDEEGLVSACLAATGARG
jgi:hypothetical protein